MYKDDSELEFMQMAAKIVDEALEYVKGRIEPDDRKMIFEYDAFSLSKYHEFIQTNRLSMFLQWQFR